MSVFIGSASDVTGIAVDGSQEAAYVAKVLATNPFSYWTQGEHEGAVAYCRINPSQNGAYDSVSLGQAGIGDGQVCPLYNGGSSYNNVFTATWAAAFNGATGSIVLWAKVADAGVWTDGTNRIAFRLDVDGANLIYLRRETTNNVLEWRYRGPTRIKAGVSTTDWMCLGLTWSGGSAQAYYNGAAEGAALAGGAWAGVPFRATIGSASVPAAAVWRGSISHVALWDSAQTPATMASLATV
jgi:hypothetical protein